jgi:adenylate kinase
VCALIKREFAYQADHDLADDTFEMMRRVETASAVIKSARTNLVSRLNSYATEHRALFTQALDLVAHELMHIVKRQALMGCAIIRSNNAMLEKGLVLNMVLDILAERGFTVILDVVKAQVPSHIDPTVPGDAAGPRIHMRTEKNFIFRIECVAEQRC